MNSYLGVAIVVCLIASISLVFGLRPTGRGKVYRGSRVWKINIVCVSAAFLFLFVVLINEKRLSLEFANLIEESFEFREPKIISVPTYFNSECSDVLRFDYSGVRMLSAANFIRLEDRLISGRRRCYVIPKEPYNKKIRRGKTVSEDRFGRTVGEPSPILGFPVGEKRFIEVRNKVYKNGRSRVWVEFYWRYQMNELGKALGYPKLGGKATLSDAYFVYRSNDGWKLDRLILIQSPFR